jgi:small-conductance mechanosensitive channel
VIVLENVDFGASFGRSRDLVRGHGWHVFGTIVLVFLVLIVVGLLIGLILAALPDAVRGLISGVVSGTLIAPFLALVVTLAYYRLKAVETTGPPTVVEPPPAV